MKSLIVLCLIGAAFAYPTEQKPAHDWQLVPDGDGKMHLVDMNPVDVEIEPAFDANADVFFVLFTRRNPTAGQRIGNDANQIRASQWNNAAQTRFIIHGFQNNHGSEVNVVVRQAFLARGDHNVVAVDWGAGANTINYITARNRVGAVGARVANFINFLVSNGFTAIARVIVTGHSLGAHIAGHTGKRTAQRLPAIFGMDPAGPLFDMGNAGDRLAASDATYVEMLATNAGLLGFDQPIGDASFYPNWGQSQPGCGVDVSGSCAHGRAYFFYAESVNSGRFVARRCANYGQITSRNCPAGQGTAVMGGDAAKSLSGVFFLETNGNSPFARG